LRPESRQRSQEYIRSRFNEYYRSHTFNVAPPTSIERREFGFLHFREKIMIRHKSFKDVDMLRRFIALTTPSDIYYSSAYYRNPEAEMNKKGWIKADVVFDIDADHLEIPCKKEHDTWECTTCGTRGKGPPPPTCRKCKGTKIRDETWICESCLEKAKSETLKLYGMLTEDFGVEEGHLKVNFTGHRGYHIHVDDQKMVQFASEERKELTDYVSGTGFDYDSFNLEDVIREIGKNSGLKYSTWSHRVAEEILSTSLGHKTSDLSSRGYDQRTVEFISDLRMKASSGGFLHNVFKGMTKAFRRRLLEIAIANCASRVDTVVTTDTHRLIRLGGTLNGKTGLKVVEVHDLRGFDPLTESVAVRGPPITVYVEESPRFRLGGSEYGPYSQEYKELPTEVALFLLCKGRAVIGGE